MALDQWTCYGSSIGPRKRICAKMEVSTIQFGCHKLRKNASRRTGYESARRTGIKTNHTMQEGRDLNHMRDHTVALTWEPAIDDG
jgi:hypothetical protein